MADRFPWFSKNLPPLAAAMALLGVSSPASAADPTTADCLAANEKSIKARSEGKLRDARSELLVCAAESCPADVRTECSRRVMEVNASMPTIVFDAKDDAGNDLSAVRVTMDGQLLVERLQGTALSLDPGEHRFRFETDGRLAVEKTLVIIQGVKDRREIILIGGKPSPALATEPPPVAPEGAAPTVDSAAEAAPAGNGRTQRILGWTGIGAGAVGITIGIIFTAQRGSKISERDAICSGTSECPPGSQNTVDSLTDEARTAGAIGSISLIAGGLLAAGGFTLLLTAPKDSSPATAFTPVIEPTFMGFSFRRTTW